MKCDCRNISEADTCYICKRCKWCCDEDVMTDCPCEDENGNHIGRDTWSNFQPKGTREK